MSDNLKKDAQENIKKASETINEARQIIDAEKIEKKNKKKKDWGIQANKLIKKAKGENEKAIKLIIKAKETNSKKESKRYAKESKKCSKNAISFSKEAIKLKNKIEENTKRLIKENLTLKNIALFIVFLYTLASIIVLGFFSKITIKVLFEIGYKYLGRYEFAQFFSIAFVMLMASILAGFVVWSAHFFNKKKTHWWFWITIILMFLIGTTGFLFVHMAIGQSNLELKLRDQSMNAVGAIKCSGSTDALMVFDNISCKIPEPALENISAHISFKINGTFTEPQNFDTLNFISPENVEYVSFEVQGIGENGKLLKLTTGNAYHFYTQEEYDELKARFIKYISAILSLIFITIPLVVYQLKKLHD